MSTNKLKTILFRQFNVSILDKAENVIKSLSLTEKIIFWSFAIMLFVSSLLMVFKINNQFIIKIPTKGGSLIEGSLGFPRFINPLLSISNADRDLTALIYSGLLKATPDGTLIPDLAKKYSISKDGLVYTFVLKDNLYFQDGKPITTDDVAFTINLSQNDIIKSFKRANWDGVKIKKINEKEIEFILKAPYSPFLENTTLGILPKHIWGQIKPEQFAFSEFNIKPIGSGPYKIKNTKKNSLGILEQYDLEPFDKYSLGESYISNLTIKFYPNEKDLISAFEKNDIESINSITPENAIKLEKEVTKIKRVPLPRIFGLFLNQNQNIIFSKLVIRKALNESLDKEAIVDKVLKGYGVAINGPIPPISKYFNNDINKKGVYNSKEAISLLEKNGWKLNNKGIREKKINKKLTPLKFTISTSEAPELKEVANMMKNQWKKIGADVTIKIFETGDLNQNVIRTRDYDSLLFGEIIGRDMDLFAFWHSSQRNDPGLNIAMYANISTDKLLEEARSIHNEKQRYGKYEKFENELKKDVPAIFIYSPDFIYIIPNKIKNLSLGQITTPSERFLNINKWYINTEKVWKIFSK